MMLDRFRICLTDLDDLLFFFLRIMMMFDRIGIIISTIISTVVLIVLLVLSDY